MEGTGGGKELSCLGQTLSRVECGQQTRTSLASLGHKLLLCRRAGTNWNKKLGCCASSLSRQKYYRKVCQGGGGLDEEAVAEEWGRAVCG